MTGQTATIQQLLPVELFFSHDYELWPQRSEQEKHQFLIFGLAFHGEEEMLAHCFWCLYRFFSCHKPCMISPSFSGKQNRFFPGRTSARLPAFFLQQRHHRIQSSSQGGIYYRDAP
jgi:hypothetical protein